MIIHVLVMSECFTVAQRYADDALASVLYVVNLIDDTCSIQIASLGPDLYQSSETLTTTKANGPK